MSEKWIAKHEDWCSNRDLFYADTDTLVVIKANQEIFSRDPADARPDRLAEYRNVRCYECWAVATLEDESKVTKGKIDPEKDKQAAARLLKAAVLTFSAPETKLAEFRWCYKPEKEGILG